MHRDVLPQFEGLPDREAAGAFSEIYLRINDFKVATDTLDDSKEFPPVPAHYTAVTAAYREAVPSDRGPRRQFTMLPLGGYSLESIGEAYVAGYTSMVGKFHELADAFQQQAPSMLNLDNLAYRAEQLAAQARLRTVASYVVCSARDSNEHFGALVIPRITYTNLPLEDRQEWLDILLWLDESSINKTEDIKTDLKNLRGRLGPVLRNDPIHGNFAFFAGALQLPRVNQMERGVAQHIEMNAKAEHDKYAGLSREERRKLQHKERRDARKHNS